MNYPIVRQQVTAKALVLSGWWFDIATGDMYAYERASRSFAHSKSLTARWLSGLLRALPFARGKSRRCSLEVPFRFRGA